MSNKIWFDIFHWKEFTNYLSTEELIELSMGSKQLRTKLSPYVFKSFNFNIFASLNNYKSYIITEDSDGYSDLAYTYVYSLEDYQSDSTLDNEFTLISNPYSPLTKKLAESKAKFKSDLNKYRNQPEKLKLANVRDYYDLLYELPNIFYNVKSLIIQSSTILFEAFQYLLDNLKYLENLELSSCKFLKCSQGSNSYSINWPSSLKKLKFKNNCISYINSERSFIILESDKDLAIIYVYLKLEPNYLPNLHILDYEPECDTDNDSELWELLKVNSHINRLKIPHSCFRPELLEIIKTFNNLKHLEITENYFSLFSRYISRLKVINSPQFINLVRLGLSITKDSTILDNMVNQFPYVTNLKVKTKYIKLSSLLSSISKFSKLKSLKVYNSLQFNEIKEINFPTCENLEKLELKLGTRDKFEELKWNVGSFSKLQLIRFINSSYYRNFDKLKLSPELESNWKLVYFPKKISFYRINK